MAKDIIEHLPNPLFAMQEIHRVTSPKGRLVVFVPRALARAVWADYTHARGFTKKSVIRLLEDSGWEVTFIRKFGAVPLAARLGFVSFIPTLLRIPGLGHYLGTNWFVIATRG